MKETWRWYGEELDKISLAQIRQTGASGIVTALHEIPYGQVWSSEAIAHRKGLIVEQGLSWDVVESLPLHEDIKRGSGELTTLFANYRQSMANLAAQGITTICYNFMPILDWTRTDLKSPVQGGGTCLRFEATKMAAFEIYMLKRRGAEADYPQEVLEQARNWYNAASQADQDLLLKSIMAGMPGAFDRYDIKGLRNALASYDGAKAADIRANYQRFLDEVIPTAQELGLRMCVHPDDPPRDILGLPRIVSDAQDIDWIMSARSELENGLTLCTGSLGAHPSNDIPAIISEHADRIHFVHLRNVRKDRDGSFEEAAHLDGDTDMVKVIGLLLEEEQRRAQEGRKDCLLSYRPDHGHELLFDASHDTFPGYPLIGRLRGLAELRGIHLALSAKN